jgi:vancomycin permeability regulator SanA
VTLRRWLKWTGIATGATFVVAIATIVGTNACISNRADDYVFETLAEIPPRSYAIVLGARVNLDGTLSHALHDRVDCAYDLITAGRVQKIFCSGDAEQADAMVRVLTERGIPADKIIRDGEGHRTKATMKNAQAAGIRDAVVCTQRFHQARSIAWARHLDIDAVGWVSNRRAFSERRKDTTREVLARTLALFEIWVD